MSGFEKRIYVVLPAAVQIADCSYVEQPAGRQVAQACHVVSKLRFENPLQDLAKNFEPITTIILQARDSDEMIHVHQLLLKRKLNPTLFSDENKEAYGDFKPITALAVLATWTQACGTLDYLPLWR